MYIKSNIFTGIFLNADSRKEYLLFLFVLLSWYVILLLKRLQKLLSVPQKTSTVGAVTLQILHACTDG